MSPVFSTTHHGVYWPAVRPDFAISILRSTSTNRGYHQTHYEIISIHPLDLEDFALLDKIGLTGMGQAYAVVKEGPEHVTDELQPGTYDIATGEPRPAIPPRSWDGKDAFTRTTERTYYRYVVRRICDSGD